MIVVGTATVNPHTGKVELNANSAMGFGTARGVRLSNFTSVSLTLTNISGVDQSQEYLAPQTQMVYPTANIGATPIIESDQPAAVIAEFLLVEWSTDPDTDFIGTYPAALPVPITESPSTGSVIFASTAPVTATQAKPFIVDTHAFDSILLNFQGGAAGTSDVYYYWLDQDQTVLSQGCLISGVTSGEVLGFQMNVKAYYLALWIDGNTHTFANMHVSAALAPMSTDVDVQALFGNGTKVFSSVGNSVYNWDNNIPVNTVQTHTHLPLTPTQNVIGGRFRLVAVYPKDAMFIIQLDKNASSNLWNGLGNAGVQVMLTAGEGTLYNNASYYVDKEITLAPVPLDFSNSGWFMIRVDVASTTTDMSLKLIPMNGSVS